jgi:transcriptional regulator with XRE-family HTH domain
LSDQANVSKLGAWIISKLEERNLRSSELAERAGISRVALHYIIKGRNAPSEETITKICRVLGASVAEAKANYARGKHTGRPKGTHNRKKQNGERLEQSSGVAPQADR